jgi:hypothetical protein
MPWGGAVDKKSNSPQAVVALKIPSYVREDYNDSMHHNKNVFNGFWKENISKEKKHLYE